MTPAIDDPRSRSFAALLETTVPFKIHELAQAGGPSERDRARVARFAQDFHDREDYTEAQAILVTGDAKGCTKKQHRVNREFIGEMIFAVAVMAFQPGGVSFSGCRFDAGRPDIDGRGGEARGLLPATLQLLAEWDTAEESA